jgi:hypothetical protein
MSEDTPEYCVPGYTKDCTWIKLINQHQRDFDCIYINSDGLEYRFFGLVHGEDDYYYGMYRNGDLLLLSCVGNLDTHGYKKKTK